MFLLSLTFRRHKNDLLYSKKRESSTLHLFNFPFLQPFKAEGKNISGIAEEGWGCWPVNALRRWLVLLGERKPIQEQQWQHQFRSSPEYDFVSLHFTYLWLFETYFWTTTFVPSLFKYLHYIFHLLFSNTSSVKEVNYVCKGQRMWRNLLLERHIPENFLRCSGCLSKCNKIVAQSMFFLLLFKFINLLAVLYRWYRKVHK